MTEVGVLLEYNGMFLRNGEPTHPHVHKQTKLWHTTRDRWRFKGRTAMPLSDLKKRPCWQMEKHRDAFTHRWWIRKTKHIFFVFALASALPVASSCLSYIALHVRISCSTCFKTSALQVKTLFHNAALSCFLHYGYCGNKPTCSLLCNFRFSLIFLHHQEISLLRSSYIVSWATNHMLLSLYWIWRQAGAVTRDSPTSEASEHDSTHFVLIANKHGCCAVTYLYDINI